MGHGYVDLESCNALENDYQAVIMRFFEGDVPIMFASGNTVSGTEKRESQSEKFSANPFKYSFHPVPSTEEGGYVLNAISIGFADEPDSQVRRAGWQVSNFNMTVDEAVKAFGSLE